MVCTALGLYSCMHPNFFLYRLVPGKIAYDPKDLSINQRLVHYLLFFGNLVRLPTLQVKSASLVKLISKGRNYSSASSFPYFVEIDFPSLKVFL